MPRAATRGQRLPQKGTKNAKVRILFFCVLCDLSRPVRCRTFNPKEVIENDSISSVPCRLAVRRLGAGGTLFSSPRSEPVRQRPLVQRPLLGSGCRGLRAGHDGADARHSADTPCGLCRGVDGGKRRRTPWTFCQCSGENGTQTRPRTASSPTRSTQSRLIRLRSNVLAIAAWKEYPKICTTRSRTRLF